MYAFYTPLPERKQVRIVYFDVAETSEHPLFQPKLGIQAYFLGDLLTPDFIGFTGERNILVLESCYNRRVAVGGDLLMWLPKHFDPYLLREAVCLLAWNNLF